MRSSLQFFLNGQSISVAGRDAFSMLAPWLRRSQGLVGTKIACAHGACGSCSVLLGRPQGEGFRYQTINGCIFPLFGCDGAHLITVEGLNGAQNLGGGITAFCRRCRARWWITTARSAVFARRASSSR